MNKRTHPSSLSFVTQSQPTEPSNRDHFLASNPRAAEEQRERILDITGHLDVWLARYADSRQALLDTGELARQIGDKILAFAESFPGKKLTEDFWLQVQDHFITPQGRKISLDMLEWFMKVARQNKEKPITHISQIPPLKEQELQFIGETESEAAAGRGLQTKHAPENPYNSLTGRWRIEEWRQDLEKFEHHQQYGDLATLKERRPDLHFELAQKLTAVHEFSEQALKKLGA